MGGPRPPAWSDAMSAWQQIRLLGRDALTWHAGKGTGQWREASPAFAAKRPGLHGTCCDPMQHAEAEATMTLQGADVMLCVYLPLVLAARKRQKGKKRAASGKRLKWKLARGRIGDLMQKSPRTCRARGAAQTRSHCHCLQCRVRERLSMGMGGCKRWSVCGT